MDGTLLTLVGDSPRIADVRHQIDQVAGSRLSVLIEGETGTGKEVVAQLIHSRSGRDPFIAVNCAGFSDSMMDAELFGHVRGAFTGADHDRAGLFEAARAGTLFLDEIGDIALDLQAKLLRVLEAGEVRRVGATRSTEVDVRVIAATNSNLSERVTNGTFRSDLYWRLKVWRVRLPPLRDRPEDIPVLVRHFLEGTPIREDALNALIACRWPGNVRELQHTVEYAKLTAAGDEILLSHLPPEFVRGPESPRPSAWSRSRPPSLREQSREYAQRVYDETGRNKSRAAQILGIDRKTLNRYLSDD